MNKDKLILIISIGLTALVLSGITFLQFKTVEQTDITAIETMRETELRTELSSWKAKYDEISLKLAETENTILQYRTELASASNASEVAKQEVKDFLSTFGYGPECVDDELYKAVLIIFKEYLLWQTCEKYLGNTSIFNKKSFIEQPKCTAHELYDWKKMWDNSKPINLILSICYKNVYQWKIIKDKADYKRFRNKLYKNITVNKEQ